MFVDGNIFNSSEASRFCPTALVMDSEEKCILQWNNFSWLPSLKRQFNFIFMHLQLVTFPVFALAATIVWIKLRQILYVDNRLNQMFPSQNVYATSLNYIFESRKLSVMRYCHMRTTRHVI